MIVTFYSFKGGVGRTMALANVGEILAEWGYRVVLCDWDLEAPGLERYFSPVDSPWFRDESARESYDRYFKDMLAHDGLMELLRDYKETLSRTPPDDEAPAVERPGYARVGKLMLRRPSVTAYAPPTQRNDRLRILSAGRRETDERLRQYAEDVRDFDWKEFYDKWAGNAYIEFFRKELMGEHGGARPSTDIVLVDSRTGVTEHGGVCTHHLADLVVLTTAPNEANVDGTVWMASALTNKKLEAMRGGRSLAVLPIVSRVEVFNEQKLVEDFEDYFVRKLTRYLPKAIAEGSEFFKESRIPYVTFYSFRERVVARESRDRRQRELYRAYAQLAHAIVRHGLLADRLSEDHTPAEFRRVAMPHSERPRRTLRGPVFISHAAEDVKPATLVAEALRRRGVQEVVPALSTDIGAPVEVAQSILPEAATVFFVVGEEGMSESMRAELDFIVHRIATGKQTMIVALLTSSRVFPSPLLIGYRSFVIPLDARADSEFFDDLIIEASGAPAPAIVIEDSRPYPGMGAYRESDARFFFGRDDEIAQLNAALADAVASPVRWLRVEGASGIGVSSIVNAGLIPAIRRGVVHGIGRDAVIAVCTATAADPLLSLASALAIAPATRVEDVRARIEKPDFAQYAELILRGRPSVLVIESLEAVVSQPEETRDAFCSALVALLSKEIPLYVISTMRAGAAARLNETPLAVLAQGASVVEILPIDPGRLHEVIAGPAALAGMAFETGLPERIVGEASATTTCPSFLASQLHRLWKVAKGRNSMLITHAMYQETGGIAGLVIEMTEETLRGFRGFDREVAQSILLRLVSGVETRLTRPVAALEGGQGGLVVRERMLLRLAGVRLINLRVTDGEEEAELTHDAVLLAPAMAKWIDEERTKIRQRSELELAARSWKEALKPSGGLPTGGQLRYFENVETTSPDVREYLKAARTLTLVRRIGFLSVSAVFFMALVVWPLIHKSPLLQSFIVNGYVDYLIESAPKMEAVDLLNTALRFQGADNEHTNHLFRVALAASIQPRTFTMDTMDMPIVAFDLSDDGRILAIAQGDRIDVYDVARQSLVKRLTSQGTLVRISLSGDGSRLFIHHSNRLPEIWHVRAPGIAWHLPAAFYVAGSEAVMSRDGGHVATLDPSGVLRIFAISGGPSIMSPSPGQIGGSRPDSAETLAFAPDGAHIVGFGRQGSIWIWTGDGKLMLNGNAHETKVEQFAFSADGSQMASYTTGRLVVWDLEGGRIQEQLSLRTIPLVPGGLAVGTHGAPVVMAFPMSLVFHRITPEGDLEQNGLDVTSIKAVGGNRFIVGTGDGVELWSAMGTRMQQLVPFDHVMQFSVGGSHSSVAGKLYSGVEVRVWDFDAMLTYEDRYLQDSQLRALAEQRLRELTSPPPIPASGG